MKPITEMNSLGGTCICGNVNDVLAYAACNHSKSGWGLMRSVHDRKGALYPGSTKGIFTGAELIEASKFCSGCSPEGLNDQQSNFTADELSQF